MVHMQLHQWNALDFGFNGIRLQPVAQRGPARVCWTVFGEVPGKATKVALRRMEHEAARYLLVSLLYELQ